MRSPRLVFPLGGVADDDDEPKPPPPVDLAFFFAYSFSRCNAHDDDVDVMSNDVGANASVVVNAKNPNNATVDNSATCIIPLSMNCK
jgi:hypothetical protein